MFIQYKLNNDERILNLKLINQIVILNTSEKCGFEIIAHYTNKDYSVLFSSQDKKTTDEVYGAFARALQGQKTTFDHENLKGFITPLKD